MPLIHLTSVIHAPVSRVFDLSRSVTLHKRSMAHLREEVLKGRDSGLVEHDETLTWRGRHLGKMRELTVKITAMRKHDYFCDEMVEGDFKFFRHQHHFKEMDNGTIMIDLMEFGTPYGFIGKWVEWLYLRKYMTRLLQLRNGVIKEYAESEKWRVILD